MTPTGDKNAAIKTINSYLASHSSQIYLKPSLPSAKDITETLKFVLTRLEFPPNKIQEDLPVVLKFLNCPVKLNESALNPHSWPSLLGAIHWLVQLAMHNDHSIDKSIFEDNGGMFIYALESFLHFIRGDDDAVDAVDKEIMDKLQKEMDLTEEEVKLVADKASQLEAMRTEPSPRESLEKKRSLLEDDKKICDTLIELLNGDLVYKEWLLEDKEKELAAMVDEAKKIRAENEELKKLIQLQGIISRDAAEMMKMELHSVEKDIEEAETARSSWEEKVWELESTIGHTLKQLEALSMECNQAAKRLKIGNGLQ